MIRYLILIVALITLMIQGCGGGFNNEDSSGSNDFGGAIFGTDTTK